MSRLIPEPRPARPRRAGEKIGFKHPEKAKSLRKPYILNVLSSVSVGFGAREARPGKNEVWDTRFPRAMD